MNPPNGIAALSYLESHTLPTNDLIFLGFLFLPNDGEGFFNGESQNLGRKRSLLNQSMTRVHLAGQCIVPRRNG